MKHLGRILAIVLFWGLHSESYADLSGAPQSNVFEQLPEQIDLLLQGKARTQAPETGLSFHNTTNTTIHCAFYYRNRQGAIASDSLKPVRAIVPQARAVLPYPAKRAGYETVLCIAQDGLQPTLHKPTLTPADLTMVSVHPFAQPSSYDRLFTGHFDIYSNLHAPDQLGITAVGGGLLPRMNRLTSEAQLLEEKLRAHFERQLEKDNPLYRVPTHIQSARGAYAVHKGPASLAMEREFLERRAKKVREAINELFGRELIPAHQRPPTIAFVSTGGGYRSMISVIGSLEGATHSQGGNLYDCFTYVTGLSGSSWALASLASSGLSPHDYAQELRTSIGKGGLNTLISDLVQKTPAYLERRFIENRYGQYHGPIGVYGHALGRALLQKPCCGKNAHQVTFSDLRPLFADGQHPLPLCVAIDTGKSSRQRVWYEFSPFYCGTHEEGGCWIDSICSGCTFHQGSPVHIAPELRLAHLIGIWGSAFAVTPEDVAEYSTLGGLIARLLPGIGLGFMNAYRLMLWGEPQHSSSSERAAVKGMPNYWYQDFTISSRLSEPHELYLVDGALAVEGGYRHNFASVPALWRGVDMLIMCDNPHDAKRDTESKHLLAVEKEAKRLGLPFPSISDGRHSKSLKTMHTDVCSVFIEEGAPIVVYIKTKRNKVYDGVLKVTHKDPRVRESGFDPDETVTSFTTTSNFQYTPGQFDLLSGLAKSIFIQCKPMIKEALKQAIGRASAC
jgi:hypothetical protein